MSDPAAFRLETRLAHAGRARGRTEGAVNPPVQRATTLLIEGADDLYGSDKKTYALDGMAVQEALREVLVAIEGGRDAILAPSGLAACTLALMTVAKSGGELLVVDCVYGPTRRFCDTALARLGVRTRYFDPRIGAGVDGLFSDATCGVFLESPGSLTFEIQDVPAIAAAAKARAIPVILDNTWSAGVYFKPFAHGVDLSVQALTKYQGGHADAFLGAVLAANDHWANRVGDTYKQLGLNASPDDAYLVLRGLRSMAARLDRQSASALQIAHWLAARAEVTRVLHPALTSHEDHAIWLRDFTGASGVFGVELVETDAGLVSAMLESLSLFAMGFSWGGYESLVVPTRANIRRTTVPSPGSRQTLRFSIGLEHVDDLIADLDAGFTRLG